VRQHLFARIVLRPAAVCNTSPQTAVFFSKHSALKARIEQAELAGEVRDELFVLLGLIERGAISHWQINRADAG
jgi:hypothetical protein